MIQKVMGHGSTPSGRVRPRPELCIDWSVDVGVTVWVHVKTSFDSPPSHGIEPDGIAN
jgi:hypothetical protein